MWYACHDVTVYSKPFLSKKIVVPENTVGSMLTPILRIWTPDTSHFGKVAALGQHFSRTKF